MKKSRRETHEFLGLLIKFNSNGSISVDTQKYLKEAIKSFNKDISKTVKSPVKRKMFEVYYGGNKLDKEKEERFHFIVEKLLWLCKQGRPVI